MQSTVPYAIYSSTSLMTILATLILFLLLSLTTLMQLYISPRLNLNIFTLLGSDDEGGLDEEPWTPPKQNKLDPDQLQST